MFKKKMGFLVVLSLFNISKNNAQISNYQINPTNPSTQTEASTIYGTVSTDGPEAPPQQYPINDFVVPFLLVGTLVGGYFFYKRNRKSTVC